MNPQKVLAQKAFLLVFFFSLLCSYLFAQQWEPLSEIPEGLTYPMVTVLDGKIHVIGGGGSSGATDVHYAYDPGTDTWTSLSPVPYLAQMPGGAAANGKIHYFGGGYPNSGTPLDDHYIYDPGTDSWAESTPLTAPRAIHYGIALNDMVYTMAGQGMTTLFEAFDSGTESWVQKANLPDGFFMYSARCTAGGKIYRFGGGAYAAPRDYAVAYDPVADEWSDLPDFPLAIHGMDGAAIGDSIYLTGGLYEAYVTNEVWIYDITTQTYVDGPEMPIERYYHSAVTIDECIYLVGGYHPIFPDSTRVSLMRYCPYGSVGIEDEANNSLDEVSIRSNCRSIILDFPVGISEEVHVELFDILGRSVYSEKISGPGGQQHTFSISEYGNAIYVLRVWSASQQCTSKLYIQ